MVENCKNSHFFGISSFKELFKYDSINMKKSQEIVIDKKNVNLLDKRIKVALVHDFLVQRGGAEKVLETLCEMFPKAPIYTIIYDKEKLGEKFGDREIKTSFLQKFPKFILRKYRRYLLPFMLIAPETFDLRDFDLVISSSGAWSKGIVTRLNTIHIAYLHSPMRFVWDYNEKYLQAIGKKIGLCKRIFLSYLRIWDYEATQRPDILIANSKYTQKRLRKYYRRESEVIYPPVFNENKDINHLAMNVGDDSVIQGLEKNTNNKKYFLVVSRLSAYKKVDLVVKAFNKLELPLIVIGEGEQEKYLRKIANKNVKILGWKKEKNLQKYYQNARALVFPTVDDFGITIVEAMNYGIPVIAIRKGGANEVVEERISGEFFDAQTVEVLSDGVRRFVANEKKYNKDIIIKKAEKFSKEKFKEKVFEVIKNITIN